MDKTFIYRDYDAKYEATEEDIREALSNIAFDLYFKNSPKADKNQIVISLNEFILNSGVEDGLAENYDDSLKEYFEEKVRRGGLYD